MCSLKKVEEITEEKDEEEELGDNVDDTETSDDTKALIDDDDGMDWTILPKTVWKLIGINWSKTNFNTNLCQSAIDQCIQYDHL